MKLKDVQWSFSSKKGLFKFLITMKFSILFLMLSTSQIFGSVYSQTVKFNLNMKNASVNEIFAAIEDQSDFRFLYHDALLEGERSHNIQFEDETINEILEHLFVESTNTFSVLENNLVVITPKGAEPLQEKTITGTVTDEQGEPMMGVNVTVKGTTVGTITDNEGNYSIVAKTGDVLQFSFIGYITKEVEVTSENKISIQLDPDIESLEEVVVVGYGTMKRSDVTGSVVSVRDEDLTAIPTTNAIEVLQGKVAGLDITNTNGRAGTTVNFRVRGRRSLAADNDPLIIVDGVIYNAGGNDLDIHPNDIASIEVLKDASSTAIYGSKGANGVILITTKKGGDKQIVSFNAYWGTVKAAEYPDFFFGETYREQQREAYRTTGDWQSPDDDEIALFPYYLYDGTHDVDWKDLVMRDGMLKNYQLSLSGGNTKTKYLLSSSFGEEEGIIKRDDHKRYSVRLNLEHEINDWASVGVLSTYSYTVQNLRNDPIGRAAGAAPVGEPYLEDGSINPFPFGDGTTLNPIADEAPGVWKNEGITKRYFNSAFLNFKIFEGLNFNTSFNADLQNRFEGIWADIYTLERAGSARGSNYASTDQRDYGNFLWKNLLSFNRDLGNHSFQFVLGNEAGWDKTETYFSDGTNFPINTFLWYNMYAAQNSTVESNFVKTQMVSYFGRMHYKFMDRYIFQFTLRSDGSSRLAPGNKWAMFPSGSFAWRVNEESFMENLTIISDLKFRASYGTSGNYAVDPYMTRGLFGRSNYSWDDELAAGYWPRTISNYDLGWETTATTNLGFDISFFRNRLNLYLDVYQQKTYDLLQDRKLPPHTGYAFVTENIGDSENKGIELSIGTVNINTPSGFKWSTDITFFANRNKIVRLSGETDRIIQEYDRRDADVYAVGHPIEVIWSWDKVGIWQSSDSLLAASYGYRPGDIRLADLNNDGKITDDDKLIIGQRDPKWSGGISNTFSYKGVELSCFIYARMGQMIHFTGYNWSIGSRYYTGGSAGVEVDYWTPTNPTNDFPRPDAGGTFAEENEALRYVDGSFVKIRDLSLAYTLPKNLTEQIRINKVRVYTTMKNWFTLYTAIPGYDTERGGSLSYPLTKQWLFGLNVEF